MRRFHITLLGAAALAETRDTILTCEICGNIDTQSPCTLCRDPSRDRICTSKISATDIASRS